MDRSLHQGKQYQYRFINRTASKLSCPEIVLMLNSFLNINQEFCQVPSSDGHLGSYAHDAYNAYNVILAEIVILVKLS